MRVAVLLFLSLRWLQPVAAQDLFLQGSELQLNRQSPWTFYNGSDAPSGAYLATLAPGISSIQASINLGTNLSPGTYFVFGKALDYDYGSQLSFSLGAGTATMPLNDRDWNGYWTAPSTLIVTSPTNELHLTVIKTQPLSTATKTLLMALLVTTDSLAAVTKDDRLVSYHYPGPSEYDTNAPVKGNLIRDGSFETGWGHGWGLAMIGRDDQLRDCWTTNGSYHGSACMKLRALPSPQQLTLVSRPYHLKPNKLYTLSAYVKSSRGRNWVAMFLKNVVVPPAGLAHTNQQIEKASILATTDWQRLSLSGVMLKYPESDFQISLTAQAYEGGDVYIDGVQLEEGNLSNFRPRNLMELGLETPNSGNVFYDDEPLRILMRVHSEMNVAVTNAAQFEVFDCFNKKVAFGATPFSVSARSTVQLPIPLTLERKGIFRINAWIPGMEASEDELSFAIVPRPDTLGLDPDSMIGSHVDCHQWQLALMQKLGVKWTRALSTAQYFRWVNAEPSEGNFVWFDQYVQRPAANGITILANLGENIPAWAQRTYFALTNPGSPGFVAGETVSSSGGSGSVSLVLGAGNATGPALQLTNVVGNFAQGDSVTGSVSQSTAVLRTRSFGQSVALDKWDNYVAAIVAHYQSMVSCWEIWNEPDQDGQEIPQPDGDTGFYAEVLRRAVVQIRTVAPKARIVGMGGVSGAGWVSSVMNLLGWQTTNDLDAISVHLYSPNGPVAAQLKTQSADIYHKPVWNTETGVWDWGFYTGVNCNFRRFGRALFPYTDSDRFYCGHFARAELMAINFLQCMGSGLSKYFYYDSRQGAEPDLYNSHPTEIDFDDSVRTKGIAYAVLAHVFDHSAGLGKLSISDANTEAFLFDKNGGGLAALYSTDLKPRQLDFSGLLQAGSLSILDLMGNTLSSSNLVVPFGRTPVYLVGKNLSPDQLRTAFLSAAISTVPDTQPPNVAITYAPRGPITTDKPVGLRWLGIDNVSIPSPASPNALVYSWTLTKNGQVLGQASWTAATGVNYSSLEPGAYVLSVQGKDEAGNLSDIVTRSFNVEIISVTGLKIIGHL